MTPSLSARLGLVVDTLNETDINTNMVNWDRVDYASGFTYKLNADTIPADKRFDGQLVGSTNSGVTFIDDNGTPRYIDYPYFITMTADWPTGFPHNAQTDTGYQSVTGGVNAIGAHRDAATGGWIVPTKGIYSIEAVFRWTANASGIRRSGFTVNSNPQTPWERIDNGIPSFAAVNMFKEIVWLNKDDLVRPYIFQNCGVALVNQMRFRAKLLRPLI